MAKNAVAKALSGKNVASFFTEEYFHQTAEQMRTGRAPMKRMQHSDEMVAGLRAQVFPSGIISYHVSFYVGDERPFMMIGYANKDSPLYLTVQEAREVAKTVIALGKRGVNPQDGLLPRLLKELRRDGERWKPKLS